MIRQDRGERGYSLLEMMVVISIVALMLLVSTPSILRWNETYLLKSNARDLANAMKLGRMKAVASNFAYRSEVNPSTALRNQCPGQGGPSPTDLTVVYRNSSSKVEECFPANRGLKLEPVGSSFSAVTFRPNGVATVDGNLNRFRVTSRNGKFCQLVCVNTLGAVLVSAVLEPPDCATPPATCEIP